ncbi:neuronal acetylcholine receptor subunit alpha-10-like [Anneissia japonica]|uniref:neuronal acetylcholine receptor subunit alpha-10-like n=1 Tax=Anneissia japonica TaxID=1529436 RepID=UPI001425B7C6|nr:neuronal acetylcholine receptor subunit alpha-10-like [Anneissia japonica]
MFRFRLWISYALLLIFTWYTCLKVCYGSPDEKRLLRDIMANYSSVVRPVNNVKDNVTVKFGVAINQIIDMDEKHQIITINVWIRMQWTDDNFYWNASHYGESGVLTLPPASVWKPDIVLYTNVDSGFNGMMETSVSAYSNGIVVWNAPAIYRSTCKIDVRYFPFDEQMCVLKFGSWAYHGFQLDIVNRSIAGDISTFIDNGEWILIGMPVKRNVYYYNCCSEPYPTVEFTMIIRRRPLFYLFNLLIPCMLITMLTLLDFYLPAEAGEKVTLAITILLALTVFLLLVAETMPPTSETVPLIGQYFAASIFLVSVSTVMTVYVLHIHYRLPGTKPVPRWMRVWIIGRLGSLICMNKDFRVNPEPSESNAEKMVVENNLLVKHTHEMTEHTIKIDNTQPSIHYKDFEKAVESIVTELKHLREISEQKDREDDILAEWKKLAMVIDRLFFWIFLISAVSCTAGILLQNKPFTDLYL